MMQSSWAWTFLYLLWIISHFKIFVWSFCVSTIVEGTGGWRRTRGLATKTWTVCIWIVGECQLLFQKWTYLIIQFYVFMNVLFICIFAHYFGEHNDMQGLSYCKVGHYRWKDCTSCWETHYFNCCQACGIVTPLWPLYIVVTYWWPHWLSDI